MTDTKTYEREAYERGCQAARDAAQHVQVENVGGARKLLHMIEIGHPMTESLLPSRPDLSAEWGGDETVHTLVHSIVTDHPNLLEAWYESIPDEWERGVSETFVPACKARLLEML